MTTKLPISSAVSGDTTDFNPPAPTPEELEESIARWGLVTAPTAASRTEANPLRPGQARRVKKILAGLGTPGDYARGLMQREVPPEWYRDLREISPKTDASSYLVFAWKEPPLQPQRGRWCLYEAIPDPLISVERRMELSSAPFWKRPKGERGAQAQQVSAYQWEMYRRDRVDVRPFWCLQGSEGGTPLHHSAIEKRYLRMMGKPSDPFAVGVLPFAPWDGRVRHQVLLRDRLSRLGGSVERMRGTGTSEAQIAANEAAEKEYRRVFWDWFTAKLGPATELYAYILKHESPDRPRQTREEHIAANEAREIFIETGRMPDPIEYRNRKLVVAAS
jgi:hypothetical protein